MTPDGYPNEQELETIRTWPLEKGWRELMEFIAERWYGENWSEVDGVFTFHTFGWSGNEALVEALQSNALFWLCCWQSSRRGGHYEFEVSE